MRTLVFSAFDRDRVGAWQDLGEIELVIREGQLGVAMQHQDRATAFAFDVDN